MLDLNFNLAYALRSVNFRGTEIVAAALGAALAQLANPRLSFSVKEDAGRATRAALKNGTGVVRTDVVSAPGAAGRGTQAAASRIWKALW